MNGLFIAIGLFISSALLSHAITFHACMITESQRKACKDIKPMIELRDGG